MDPLALAAKCLHLLALAQFLHGALLLHHPAITKNLPAVALGPSLVARH
jgi:hypothetical protein